MEDGSHSVTLVVRIDGASAGAGAGAGAEAAATGAGAGAEAVGAEAAPPKPRRCGLPAAVRKILKYSF